MYPIDSVHKQLIINLSIYKAKVCLKHENVKISNQMEKQKKITKKHTCKALSKRGLSFKISLNNLLALLNCPIVS